MGPKGPGLLVVHVFKLLNSDNHRHAQSERMTDRMTERQYICLCDAMESHCADCNGQRRPSSVFFLILISMLAFCTLYVTHGWANLLVLEVRPSF